MLQNKDYVLNINGNQKFPFCSYSVERKIAGVNTKRVEYSFFNRSELYNKIRNMRNNGKFGYLTLLERLYRISKPSKN